MKSHALTLPTSAAVCVKQQMKDLGYQEATFARTRLCVGADTFDLWLRGSLPIPLASLHTMLAALELSPQQLFDKWDELYQVSVRNNLSWLFFSEYFAAEGVLPFAIRHEHFIQRVIKNLHPALLPLAPHLRVVTGAVRVTYSTENFNCVISQSLCDVCHVVLARISTMLDKTILSSFITEDSGYVESSDNSIELSFPRVDQTMFFLASDDPFSVELLKQDETKGDVFTITALSSLAELCSV